MSDRRTPVSDRRTPLELDLDDLAEAIRSLLNPTSQPPIGPSPHAHPDLLAIGRMRDTFRPWAR